MAVTRSLAQLAGDLRIGDGTTEPAGAVLVLLSRIAATATAMVEAYAENAPDAIHDEAFVRVAGWLYDADPSGANPGGPAAMRSSGAASLLSRYRVRRGGFIGRIGGGTVTTPGGGSLDTDAVLTLLARVLVAGTHIMIARNGDEFVLSASGAISATDQVARDAAAAAQGDVDALDAVVDALPTLTTAPAPTGGGDPVEIATLTGQSGSSVTFPAAAVAALDDYPTIEIRYSDSSVSTHCASFCTDWLRGAGGRTVRVPGLQIGTLTVGVLQISTNGSKTTLTIGFPNSGSGYSVTLVGMS